MVDGPELRWTEGDRWHAKITLPSGSVYEYKYVLLDSSGTHALTWQRGNNSVLAIQKVCPLHLQHLHAVLLRRCDHSCSSVAMTHLHSFACFLHLYTKLSR